MKLNTEIGYVENSIRGGELIEIWFYKKVLGRWVKIKKERLNMKRRIYCLNMLLKEGATLTPLGRA